MTIRVLVVILIASIALGACTSTSKKAPSSSSGGYYQDDGPGDAPANIDSIADAVPKVEVLHRGANRPYVVLGRHYVPATTLRPYKERGTASWYGRKFHGLKTSIGETYDMYAMTAAHPTLPLPSYARVTSVATGKSVVVRVNDRGPFINHRLIDLSYAAAHRIGIAQKGSGEVLVEAILPGESALAHPASLPQLDVAAARPTPAVEATSITGISGGFTVQLGAFANNANAQSFLERVQSQLSTAQVEAKVRQADGLFRVYVGPYPNRDAAKAVAQRLESAFGLTTALAAQ